MSSTTRSHFPFGLYVCVFRTTSFLTQTQETTNVRARIFFAYSATISEFAIHISSCPHSSHTMSLYIDMKIILPVNCSGSHCITVIIFWISARICNAVNPGKFFHSNSLGSPSIRSNFQPWDEFTNQLFFSFRALAECQEFFPCTTLIL